MERAKAERTILRRKFTLSANDLEAAIEKNESPTMNAFLEKLQEAHDRLSDINNTILTLWLDQGERDQKEFEADQDSVDEYDKRWFLLKHKASAACVSFDSKISSKSESSDCKKYELGSAQRHRLVLPKIELGRFDGQVKNWICFWSQFEKIHNSDELSDDEKFHYLLQAMEKGSSAREMVESFPPCGKNYPKVIDRLKERFANEELIIDYYVRELLQLVIGKGVTKLSTTALYDKIMTQIMALESLGLTQDKYASFLYPLVESALPDDVLRAWNRSHLHREKHNKQLSKLLEFLKLEVDSEERIHAAKFTPYTSTQLNTPTATCLTTAVIKEKNVEDKRDVIVTCIWCDKSFHTSSECTTALKMSLEKRKEFLKEKRACLICMKKGHIAKICRKFPKCVLCGRRHYTLMCADVPKSSHSLSNKEIAEADVPQRAVLSQTEENKSNSTVLLQTLKIRVLNGDKAIIVRALLDTGAQRTFIKKKVADTLKLKPVSEEEISHNLFGGTVTKKRPHKLYDLKISSLDGVHSCNFNALEQSMLCSFLPQLKKGSILKELEQKGISLTDCIDDNTEIGLLIGSDVLGSLLTGRMERVNDNLVAMETKLGWTVQGPVVGAFSCTDNQVSALHAFCDYGNREDFRKLETLGIRDDAEVKSRETADSEVQNLHPDDRNFLKLLWWRDNEFNTRIIKVFRKIKFKQRLKKGNKLVWRFRPPSAPWWGGFWPSKPHDGFGQT